MTTYFPWCGFGEEASSSQFFVVFVFSPLLFWSFVLERGRGYNYIDAGQRSVRRWPHINTWGETNLFHRHHLLTSRESRKFALNLKGGVRRTCNDVSPEWTERLIPSFTDRPFVTTTAAYLFHIRTARQVHLVVVTGKRNVQSLKSRFFLFFKTKNFISFFPPLLLTWKRDVSIKTFSGIRCYFRMNMSAGALVSIPTISPFVFLWEMTNELSWWPLIGHPLDGARAFSCKGYFTHAQKNHPPRWWWWWWKARPSFLFKCVSLCLSKTSPTCFLASKEEEDNLVFGRDL